jgi:hypothetical protein
MGTGKILGIIAALLTLVSTYLLALFGGTGFYAYGIGAAMNLASLFTSGDPLGIIIGILIILLLLSGIFQLVGLKARFLVILGSIIALFMGIFIVLALYGVIPGSIGIYVLLLGNNPIVEGILPLNVPLGTVSLGTYLLIAGGVLGLVAGIMGMDDY